MPIVGERPSHGLRVHLERVEAVSDSAWTYVGFLATPDSRYDLEVSVAATGAVTVAGRDPGTGLPLPDDLADKTKLIVRAAHKHAREGAPESPPPRRIQRWRGEK
ncbi:MAG: hypothetical protein U0169_22885 [Polyangiaceae bacterium]